MISSPTHEDESRTMASATNSYEAANAVFNTPELVTMILLLLPARDVLRLQRVSDTFKAAIPQCIWLRIKLFLADDPDIADAWWEAQNSHVTICHGANPLNPYLKRSSTDLSKCYVYHPLFSVPFTYQSGRSHSPLSKVAVPSRIWRSSYAEQQKFSCWKMFLTKPAVEDVRVNGYWRKKGDGILGTGIWTSHEVWEPNGVKCGDVLAKLEKMRNENGKLELVECDLSLCKGVFIKEGERERVESGGGVLGTRSGNVSTYLGRI